MAKRRYPPRPRPKTRAEFDARQQEIWAELTATWRGLPEAALVQARTAIERVYYNHRLGQKPPFEQVSPPSLIERLVKEDLRKEAVLKQVYGERSHRA